MRAALIVGCALWTAGVAWADKPIPQLIQESKQNWKRVRASGQKGYREKIPDELSAKLRQFDVGRRDTPLAVGEHMPAVSGLPTARPLAIVFFRGHW